MKINNPLNIAKCNELAQKIREKFNLKNSLYLNCTMYKLFNSFENNSDKEIVYGSNKEGKDVLYGDPMELLDTINESFDFIIGDLPFGVMPAEWKDKKRQIKLKERKNWLILFKSLFSLSGKGYGLFAVEPSIFLKKEFIIQLNQHGFYVNAVFACPEKIFSPHTSLEVNMLLISKQKTDSTFAIELNENSIIEEIIENYIQKSQGSDFSTGLWVMFDKFRGIKETKAFDRITRLLEQYKTFKMYSIKEISTGFKIGDKIYSIDNAIYIPRNGKIVQKDFNKLKSKNYYQIVLNPIYAIADYLMLFFNTDVGRGILELIETGNYIPNKKRSDVENLEIPLPELSVQNEIVGLNKKLNELNNKIANFEKEIAISPLSCKQIKSEVDKMLDSLDLLNDSDKILSLIREGESKIIEFKETLTKNVKTNQKDKKMEKAVLKTVVAFLNTEGGTLLVGIADNGNIEGIEKDIFQNNDDYLKHLHNLIRDQVGEQFFPLIDFRILIVNNKKVVKIDCKKSKNPVFLGKDEEFYIRSNPATDKLTGKKLVEYIKNHFNGNL